MSSDKIKEMLVRSSQKLAREIAAKMKEKSEVEENLTEYTNQITFLEAKIEVHREKKDEHHQLLGAKKQQKSELFDKRDSLINEKRIIQSELDEPYSGSKTSLHGKIDELSNQIGEVIEQSKGISAEMQELYEKAQEETKLMNEAIDDLKQLQQDVDDKIFSYKKKMATIDNDLAHLRRKMKEIQDKIGSE